MADEETTSPCRCVLRFCPGCGQPLPKTVPAHLAESRWTEQSLRATIARYEARAIAHGVPQEELSRPIHLTGSERRGWTVDDGLPSEDIEAVQLLRLEARHLRQSQRIRHSVALDHVAKQIGARNWGGLMAEIFSPETKQGLLHLHSMAGGLPVEHPPRSETVLQPEPAPRIRSGTEARIEPEHESDEDRAPLRNPASYLNANPARAFTAWQAKASK